MALQTKISQLIEPKIKLDHITIKDAESDNNTNFATPSMVRKSQQIGDLSPYIRINDFTFDHNEIESMTLSEVDVVPTIKVFLIDKSGSLASNYFPTNKNILKLYIRSRNDKVKAVRMDFLIDSLTPTASSNMSAASEGRETMFVVSGTLNTPLLYNSEVNCFDDNSFDSFAEIARKTSLGFASNEMVTNDKMPWLQTNIQYKDLLSNICGNTYKDSDSFYTWFIDKNYCINLINVNDMLSSEADEDKMFLSVSTFLDYTQKDDNKDDAGVPFVLSNVSSFNGTPAFIESFTPISRLGSVLKDNPSHKQVFFYHNTMGYNNFDVYPLNTIENEDDIDKNILNMWEGVDYDNTHDNYIFAGHHNAQNLIDLNKITLQISLTGANLSLRRGMRVPILIIYEGHENNIAKEGQRIEEPKAKEQVMDNVRIDENLYGFCYVSKVKIVYDKNSDNRNNFTTMVELCKRKWPKSLKIEGV